MTPDSWRARRARLLEAVRVHAGWAQGLREAIDDGTAWIDLWSIEPERACGFGRYLTGPSLDPSVVRRPRYAQVRALHARFHELAARVVLAAQSGEREDAAEVLRAEFDVVSLALLAAMSAWVRELTARIATPV